MQDEDTQTTGSTGAVPADDTSTDDVSGGAPVGGADDVNEVTSPVTSPVEEEAPVVPEVPVEKPEAPMPETPSSETPAAETPVEEPEAPVAPAPETPAE